MEDAWSVPAVWPAGIFFFSVPLDGCVLLFSVPMSIGGLDGLAGCAGGFPWGPTKEPPPFQVRGTSTGRKKSWEGDGSDDGVGFPCFTRWRDPGPRPTKGSASPPLGPEVGTDDGVVWS